MSVSAYTPTSSHQFDPNGVMSAVFTSVGVEAFAVDFVNSAVRSAYQLRTTGSDTSPSAGISALSANMLHIDGKEAIDGNDPFLRINQNNDFTSGIYTPGTLRIDGNFYVGSAGATCAIHSSAFTYKALGVAYWNTAGQTVAKMTISTSAASGGANGDIHFKY